MGNISFSLLLLKKDMSNNNNEALNAAKDLVAGAVGGIAQVVTGHPLDTIKVRLQTQTPLPDGSFKYNGFVDCTKTMLKEEGVSGLYKGVASPLVGFAALNSVLFSAYYRAESMIRTSNNYKEEEILSLKH